MRTNGARRSLQRACLDPKGPFCSLRYALRAKLATCLIGRLSGYPRFTRYLAVSHPQQPCNFLFATETGELYPRYVWSLRQVVLLFGSLEFLSTLTNFFWETGETLGYGRSNFSSCGFLARQCYFGEIFRRDTVARCTRDARRFLRNFATRRNRRRVNRRIRSAPKVGYISAPFHPVVCSAQFTLDV